MLVMKGVEGLDLVCVRCRRIVDLGGTTDTVSSLRQ